MSNQEPVGYPFKKGLESKPNITPGVFSEIKQFQDDDRWIVKEYVHLIGSLASPELQFQLFRDQVKKSDDLIEEFGPGLKKFIPEHQLIFGTNAKGEKSGFMAMKKVKGEDLEKMKTVSTELVTQLEEIIGESVKFYRNNFEKLGVGYFPDLMPPQNDDNVRFGNLMWGELEGKTGLYWIDTYPLRRYEDPAGLAVTLQVMMQMFELEKGAKFADGFIQKMTHEIEVAEKKGVVK